MTETHRQMPPDEPESSDGDHWFGLKDAATIRTGNLLETRIAVDYAVREKVICLVYGEAGLGKSFSAREALQRWRDTVKVTKVEFSAGTGMKGIAAKLVAKCTGIAPSGNLRHIEQDLWPILADHGGVVVIDETQRLNHEALEYLRYLHDDRRTDFGMVLIGGHGCWEVISRYPMLESRILVPVRFAPLSSDETLKEMPRYHRIYARADPDLLLLIHTDCTHGVFRSWARFTRLAADVCDRKGLDTINESVVQIVFHLLGKG